MRLTHAEENDSDSKAVTGSGENGNSSLPIVTSGCGREAADGQEDAEPSAEESEEGGHGMEDSGDDMVAWGQMGRGTQGIAASGNPVEGIHEGERDNLQQGGRYELQQEDCNCLHLGEQDHPQPRGLDDSFSLLDGAIAVMAAGESSRSILDPVASDQNAEGGEHNQLQAAQPHHLDSNEHLLAEISKPCHEHLRALLCRCLPDGLVIDSFDIRRAWSLGEPVAGQPTSGKLGDLAVRTDGTSSLWPDENELLASELLLPPPDDEEVSVLQRDLAFLQSLLIGSGATEGHAVAAVVAGKGPQGAEGGREMDWEIEKRAEKRARHLRPSGGTGGAGVMAAAAGSLMAATAGSLSFQGSPKAMSASLLDEDETQPPAAQSECCPTLSSDSSDLPIGESAERMSLTDQVKCG